MRNTGWPAGCSRLGLSYICGAATIRLSRGGAKKRPFYHITVTDSRSSRDGRFIERIGFFNPRATGGEERLRLDQERMDYWRSQGAQMSPRVVTLARDAAKAPSTEA